MIRPLPTASTQCPSTASEHAAAVPWPRAGQSAGPCSRIRARLARMAFTVGLTVSLCFTAALQAADMATALRYHEFRDYDSAFSAFMELAEAGDTAAQANVGYYYDNGLAVARDADEAARWYRLAAEAGDVTAQYNLGILYETGDGVARDYTEAFRWFRAAAEQGDTKACIYVGLFLEEGLGRQRDPVMAFAWYTAAAEGGDPAGRMKREEIAPALTAAQLERAEAEAAGIIARLRDGQRPDSGRGV